MLLPNCVRKVPAGAGTARGKEKKGTEVYKDENRLTYIAAFSRENRGLGEPLSPRDYRARPRDRLQTRSLAPTPQRYAMRLFAHPEIRQWQR